jgi:hypothetical protein
LDKVPANVRERFDKLENKDLPRVAPDSFVENEDIDNDNDNDNDNDKDDGSDETTVNVSDTITQISCPHAPRFARNVNFLSV